MRTHRGLSSVVGAVFLIAIIVSSLTYISYSLETMGNFSEALITGEERMRDKQGEAYEITSIEILNDKLGGVIKNTGEIPVKLTTLWIDEQGVNDVVKKFVLDEAIAPGRTVKITDLVDYTIDPLKGYNMKVVSSRGEVNSFYVNSPSQESLLMQIRAIPKYVPSEFATTVVYSIVNNMSNNNVLYNVTPELTITDLVGSNVYTDIGGGPTPASYPVLAPGDVAIFEYSIQLIGDVDDSVRFNATISNGVSTNWVATTAEVQEVTVATQAGTALESFGLSTQIATDLDILYFHDDNNLTPNGEYHMDGADVIGGGITGELEDTNFKFMTSNVTESTVVLPGKWNVTLAYYNELVPEGITAPSFAFMMECNDCPSGGDTYDSTGNISSDDFEANGNPVYSQTGGPDNKGYFSYDGDDRHHAEWEADEEYSAYQDIGSNAVTTAVWFKIDDVGVDNYMPIIRWGDENESGEDEYEIAIGDGTSGNNAKIVYRYATSGDNDETKCMTNGVYDDDQWHFAVGTRPVDDDCELYIDGVLEMDVSSPYCINGCGGSSSVDIDGTDDIFIGFNGDADYLTGDVAMVMHWNSVSLSAANILDLNNTNYGTNATRAQILIERTDTLGVVQEELYNQVYSFDFFDVSLRGDTETERIDLKYNDNNWKKYNEGNFTFSTIANTTFNVGERLRFTMNWDGDSQNLPFHFRFEDDDSNFVTKDAETFFQTPETIPSWPTFLSFDRDDEVEYTVFNNGPNGAWFTFGGTRFVVTTPDALESYGAMPIWANGTTMSSIKDSIYYPDQTYATIRFDALKNPPQGGGTGTKPPVGNYVAAVFLNGYDDKGEVFLRTINLGSVYVHDNG